eukprot:793122-Pleurochrysis_carterae.AAC.2
MWTGAPRTYASATRETSLTAPAKARRRGGEGTEIPSKRAANGACTSSNTWGESRGKTRLQKRRQFVKRNAGFPGKGAGRGEALAVKRKAATEHPARPCA